MKKSPGLALLQRKQFLVGREEVGNSFVTVGQISMWNYTYNVLIKLKDKQHAGFYLQSFYSVPIKYHVQKWETQWQNEIKETSGKLHPDGPRQQSKQKILGTRCAVLPMGWFFELYWKEWTGMSSDSFSLLQLHIRGFFLVECAHRRANINCEKEGSIWPVFVIKCPSSNIAQGHSLNMVMGGKSEQCASGNQFPTSPHYTSFCIKSADGWFLAFR